MAKSLYIAGLDPASGKVITALGLMEELSGHLGNVCVFRPVLFKDSGPDRLISLLTDLYRLSLPAEDLYGVTIGETMSLLAAGKYEELYGRILERYKSVESRCDFVLCVGTDYSGVATALEFDFNVQVARNLGSPIVPVINGLGRGIQSIVNTSRGLVESLESAKTDLLALIVNRVGPDRRENLLAAMKESLGEALPVFVIPEEPLLERLTVREIAAALGAELTGGHKVWLDGDIRNIKVAAMELPNFLDHIEDGDLVLTPGDRSDIILGTLAADHSFRYPRVAGLVLTGGLKPAPQVQRLIEGFMASPVPVMCVKTDTFTTAVNVNEVRPSLTGENRRKIAAALGMFESSVDVPGLLQRIALEGAGRITPLMFQYELVRRAKAQRRHIVLPEGTEGRILRAAEIVLLRDICDITLLGKPEEVMQKAEALGLSLDGVKIIDPPASELLPAFSENYYELRRHKGISSAMARDTMTDVSYFGTMMVYRGHADGMVSGSVHTTAHTIRPALEFVKTRPGTSTVSSVFFMCLADRVLVYGDCAIIPEPTAEQLAEIAMSSARTAAAFGIEPRVAMLSYSTGESGTGPDVDRVREATRIAHERQPDLRIAGPIQYDAAVDPTVAKVKMPDSDVAGQATVFIFPDLSAGNNAYKAVQRAADAIAIGPVLQGLKKPVNDLSRGALVPDIVNTIAITAIQAQTEAGE